MASVSMLLTETRRQLDDFKDDRLVADQPLYGTALVEFDESSLEDLSGLVGATASIGAVEISEVVMCAKCVGECKVF